jgi:hypothetical protein
LSLQFANRDFREEPPLRGFCVLDARGKRADARRDCRNTNAVRGIAFGRAFSRALRGGLARARVVDRGIEFAHCALRLPGAHLPGLIEPPHQHAPRKSRLFTGLIVGAVIGMSRELGVHAIQQVEPAALLLGRQRRDVALGLRRLEARAQAVAPRIELGDIDACKARFRRW